jgi:hypothetical protein
VIVTGKRIRKRAMAPEEDNEDVDGGEPIFVKRRGNILL